MPDARLQVYLGEDGPYGGWPGAVSDQASGKIFAVPAYANHGVLVIDPSLSTNGGPLFSTGASPFGLSVLPVPAAPFQAGYELGWTAAVQDPVSRKIIGLPRSGATGLLVIDPNDESVEVVRLSGAVREYMASAARRPQWTGAAYHPWTRNIVAVPSNGPLPVGTFISPRQDLLKIDPATMATQLQHYDPPRNDAGGNRVPAVVEGWQTAVFEPISGQIIGIPFTAPSVLAVDLPDGVVSPTDDPTAAPVTTAPATTTPTISPSISPTTREPTPAPTPGSGLGSGSPNDGWRAVVGYHCSSGYTQQVGFRGFVTLAQCKDVCLGISSCDALFYNGRGNGYCYTVAGSCTNTIRSSGWTIYFQPSSSGGSGGSGGGSGGSDIGPSGSGSGPSDGGSGTGEQGSSLNV